MNNSKNVMVRDKIAARLLEAGIDLAVAEPAATGPRQSGYAAALEHVPGGFHQVGKPRKGGNCDE